MGAALSREHPQRNPYGLHRSLLSGIHQTVGVTAANTLDRFQPTIGHLRTFTTVERCIGPPKATTECWNDACPTVEPQPEPEATMPTGIKADDR